jgi:hypothetical protein
MLCRDLDLTLYVDVRLFYSQQLSEERASERRQVHLICRDRQFGLRLFTCMAMQKSKSERPRMGVKH